MIGGGQNRLSELLYASHTLGGSQNRLSELHLAVVKTHSSNFYKPPTCLAVFKTDSYTHGGGPLRTSTSILHTLRWSKQTLQEVTQAFGGVKTDSTDSYKGLVAVKTDSPNFYRPPARLAVVKMEFPNFYKLGCGQNRASELPKNRLRAWRWPKWTFRTSASIPYPWQCSKRTV